MTSADGKFIDMNGSSRKDKKEHLKMTFLKSGAVGETARLFMPLDVPGPRSMCHLERANFADVETHLLLRQ